MDYMQSYARNIQKIDSYSFCQKHITYYFTPISVKQASFPTLYSQVLSEMKLSQLKYQGSDNAVAAQDYHTLQRTGKDEYGTMAK
jgi:hypothetical protein